MFLILFSLVLFNIIRGSEKYFNLAVIVLYPWLISLYFQNIQYKKREVMASFYFIGVSALILGTLLFFNQGNGVWDFSLEYILTRSRQGSVALHDTNVLIGPTQLSSLFGLAYVIFIYSFKLSSNYITILIRLFVLIYICLIILVLSSRTTWVSLILITMLIIFQKISLKQIAILLFLSVSTIFIIKYVDYILPGFDKYQSDILTERMSFIYSPTDHVHLGSRIIRWSLAIDLAKNNFIGRGYSHYDNITDGGTPHNEMLGQIIGVGYLGLILVVCIYVILYRKIRFLFSHYDNLWANLFKIIFLYAIIVSMFENYSYAMYNRLHPFLWICFGIIISIHHEKNQVINS